MSGRRALLHLVASGSTAELGEMIEEARRPGVTRLTRAPDCFMGDASPFVAALEARGDGIEALTAVAAELGPTIDAERSMAIIGTDHVFIDPTVPSPLRYQYLMRRRSDFAHEGYLERYRTIHSDFGLETPNIEGYTQLHVDLEASAALAAATGLTAAACDSMSELHLTSVDHFIEGIVAHPSVGREAQEDEERFVDRPASFGFTHTVLKD